MIRTVNQSDIFLVQHLTSIKLSNIDFDNSAISIGENGIVNACVLSIKEELINVFPKKSFPNTRQIRCPT